MSPPYAQLHRTLSSALLAAVVLLCQVRTAFAITYDSANNEFFETIDDWGQSSGTDKIGIRFGASLQESLLFDQTLGKFIFSDDLDVRGTLSGSALTIQGGNSTFLGRVGIGSPTTPDAQLEVVGTISGSNIRVLNTLSVSGSIALEQSATLSGSVLRGFGLSDCDNATTSKLLWDATTGRFSCGTDQSGSAPEVGTEAFTGGVIRIGDSRYVLTQGDTMTGGLSIDGQTDQVQLNVQGNITQSNNIVDIENYDATANYMVIDGGGATQFFSNVTLGDSSSDTVVFNGYVSSSILPSSDLNYDLGGPSNRWGNIYGNNGYFYSANGTYISGTNVNGTYGTFNNVTITNLTSCNGTSTLDTDASGNVICGTDDVGGNMSYFSITDGFTTEQVDNAETITFSDGTDINVSVSPTNTVSVAFTNATGYITGSNVSAYETDPVYNANVFATSMNQNVTTTSGPTFSSVTLSGMTQGSVVFAGPSGLLSQDNSMFYWDDATDELGIGTGTPDRRLEVHDSSGSPQMRLSYTDSVNYTDFTTDLNGDLTISPSGGNVTFGGNVSISGLINCDTVDTDASGNLICGTDDGGGGGISYATAEDIFVNQAGDTMTGALNIQDGNTPAASVATLLNVRGAMSGKLLRVSGTGASTAPLIATDLRFGSIVMGTGAIQDGNRRIMPQLLVKNRVPTRFIGSGSMAGNPNQLTVQGSYAYIATEGASAGLRIFDITNPNRPTSIGFLTLANSPQAVAVQGQYAYLTSDPLSIVDISNPSAPRLISEVDVDGGSYQIAVQGSYAYVPSQVNDMLEIIDISNPQYPTVAARIATGADPWGVAVQGKYAFVTNSAAHTMVAVDISNPKKPFIADERSTGFNPYGIAVQGRYAYVSNDNGVETYDISNPTNIPTALNAMPQDSGSFVLQADGKHLYGAQYNANSMLIADISDPARPIRMGTIATLDFDGVVVQGRYIYGTAYGAKSLTIYDMGGAQIDQLEAGATQLGSLDVKTSATINGDIDVRGTGTFGRGIHTTGPSTVHQTSTGAFASTIASATGALRLAAQGTVSQPHLQFGTGTTFDVKLFRPSAGTLRTDGTLQVVNVLSGASLYATRSFSGAGLSASTDCDNATTSKLLWDASTGRFSCGTDQSGSGGNWSGTGALRTAFDLRYVNTFGDTMTGALTVQNGNTPTPTATPLVNVRGVMSGAIIRAQTALASSGTLVFEGAGSGNSLSIGGGAVTVSNLGAAVFNELGRDVDTRFEGDTDQNLVLFDASTDRVGIGTATPDAKLDVMGTISGSSLQINGTSNISGGRLSVYYGGTDVPGNGQMYIWRSAGGNGGGGLRDTTSTGLAFDVYDGVSDWISPLRLGRDGYGYFNSSVTIGGSTPKGMLDVMGTASGITIHASRALASSGTLVFDGAGSGNSLSIGGGAVTVSNLGAAVFNELGRDVDTRFEGDTDQNLMFFDASTDRVGIGTATPDSKLEVIGTMSGTVVRAQNTLASSGTLVFEGAASGSSLYLGTSFEGAGLSDCDAGSTSKLLWDATTKRFSCGTDQGGGGGGISYATAEGIFVNQGGDTMTGGLTINMSTADIVRSTSGRTLPTDFLQVGATMLNLISEDDYLTIAEGAIPSSGQGTMSTSTTTTSAAVGAGAFTILRSDGKYIIVHGNSSATATLWDGIASGAQSATSTNASSANIGAGALALKRPDGRYLVINGGAATTSALFDPYGITATAAGPALTSCTATTGTNAFSIGSGSYVIMCGGSGNWGYYSPVGNTYTAGTAIGATFGAGAHAIQRDDGTFLVFVGGNTSTHYLFNPNLNRTYQNPWSAANPITSNAPTITTGAFSIRRSDGKYLVIGGAQNASTIYDPTPTSANGGAGSFTAQSGAGYGPTAALGDGAQALWRQDGRYLMMIGASTTTNIIDPSRSDAGQFTAGPTLPGTPGAGAHMFIRRDGKAQIIRGGASTTTDTYDMGYVIGGPSTSTGAIYETECITAPSTNTGSRLFWNANVEGKIGFEVRTGNGSCSSSYKTIQNSGDLIRPTAGHNRVQVRVTFQRSLPKFADQEWGLRRGLSQTRYRRVNQDNTLYDLRIANTSLLHRTQFEFGNSPSPSGPVAVNINAAADRKTELALETLDSAYRSTVNATNHQIYHGVFGTHPVLPTAATIGTVVLKRPDGKFVVISGSKSTPNSAIYDPDYQRFDVQTNVPTTVTSSGALAFKRPDGKFLIVMGNTSNRTNIYDPVANTFTEGPRTTGLVGEGSIGLPLPNGRVLVLHGNFQRTSSLYDPYQNVFATGSTTITVIGRGSLAIPRPDGKWLLLPGTSTINCALQTATTLFDPYTMTMVLNTNAPLVGGTGPGATAFQRSDGQWVIIKGGATANTCAALTSLNVYNPFSNRMWASAATVSNARYGAQVIQRPDNTWLISPGGGNTATQIYYEKVGTNVTDSADGPGGLVLTGPSLVTAAGTGSLFFQREDGKYVVINGANAVASAGTTTVGTYDAGWVTSGFYRSENMNITDLDSASTLTWRASSNPSDISAEVRTATGELLLQKARAREIAVPGGRINPGANETWAQVQFNMRRRFPLYCGLAEDVCYLGGIASVIPLRKPTTPTITEFGINKDKDLMELQSDSLPIFRVSTNGDIYAGEKGSIFTGGADLAERYSSPDMLEPGEVVAFDFANDHSVRRATSAYQTDVVGVVSTNPGFVAGTYTKGSYPIALVGRVPVKVTTENGDILPGDRLVASSTPGHAMKALRAGRTVGIVMTAPDRKSLRPCAGNSPFQHTMCGEAMMFVNLSDYAGK